MPGGILPHEACGYLAGKNGVVLQAYELTNIDHSPEHFSFDPSEQFLVVKKIRNAGFEVMANYHSHPSTPARPSAEDIRLAYDPLIRYVIISLAGDKAVIRTFGIKDGLVNLEETEIIS